MKSLWLGLAAIAISFNIIAADNSAIAHSINTIRAVGAEGQGNAAAAKAWQSLAKADAAASSHPSRLLGALLQLARARKPDLKVI